MIKKISNAYVGGLLGALVDSFNIWMLGKIGFTAWIGVGLRPEFRPAWLYPRLVWGGIWGLLLLLPIMKSRPIPRGMLMSLVPTAMVYFVMFPEMGKETFGLGFGLLTPVLVLFLNFIWGIVAASWYEHGR
ncbi:MAG: hypothetical protein KKC76_21375 [Proteobacteria bacterium]|nr:hypothetical protein [Pseudomonadota bacterium]MBU4296504.1 hypothetical protein [Pseudomonadota bacterium]MCG2745981.1 hypothetical protein [Desulfobulbaceae bacterium]